jgi:hypothetical protein
MLFDFVKLTAMLFDFVKLTASEKIQNSVEMLFVFVRMMLFAFVRLMAQKHRRCRLR